MPIQCAPKELATREAILNLLLQPPALIYRDKIWFFVRHQWRTYSVDALHWNRTKTFVPPLPFFCLRPHAESSSRPLQIMCLQLGAFSLRWRDLFKKRKEKKISLRVLSGMCIVNGTGSVPVSTSPDLSRAPSTTDLKISITMFPKAALLSLSFLVVAYTTRLAHKPPEPPFPFLGKVHQQLLP
ncbi:hypothetical protein AN958_03343 [Leucoagaricus sp. SymC.cos]|nr:hypothetical protein AN958_03343 [Leucoagaricus sp. SymC.cos]